MESNRLFNDSRYAVSEGDVRLTGSTASDFGRLEIYLRGEWGTVCDDSFSLTEANVACRQLGFPSASGHGDVGDFG